jgi:hypothetical protein
MEIQKYAVTGHLQAVDGQGRNPGLNFTFNKDMEPKGFL